MSLEDAALETENDAQTKLEHFERGDIPIEIRGRTKWLTIESQTARMFDDFEERCGIGKDDIDDTKIING